VISGGIRSEAEDDVSDVRDAGRRLAGYGPAEVWLCRGDITELEVDAIVNAANNQGWLGSGVAGAIRRAAGDDVEREAVAQAPWPLGDAVRTGPGRLARRGVKAILHAAALAPGEPATAAAVGGATEASLRLAAAEDLASIALPALGTGVGGLDYASCATAMGGALRRHFDGGRTAPRLVAFVLFDAAALEEFGSEIIGALRMDA